MITYASIRQEQVHSRLNAKEFRPAPILHADNKVSHNIHITTVEMLLYMLYITKQN